MDLEQRVKQEFAALQQPFAEYNKGLTLKIDTQCAGQPTEMTECIICMRRLKELAGKRDGAALPCGYVGAGNGLYEAYKEINALYQKYDEACLWR